MINAMADIQLINARALRHPNGTFNGSWRKDITPEALIVEAWGEGFVVGSLMIMACITVANMKKGILLHKLILLEILLAIMHGTFCFASFDGYGWYLSSTAALLYTSWLVHNIVAWMKIRPFFIDEHSIFPPKTGRMVRLVYLVSLAMTVPPIILQITCNFLYFNNINNLYVRVRPTEAVFRDPWWVFSCLTLFHVIGKCYGTSVFGIISRSPRLGILLASMCLAMIFTLMDILATCIPKLRGGVNGINPYWKLALVFKCLTDNIMLDDFKTELKRLGKNSILECGVLQEPDGAIPVTKPVAPKGYEDMKFETSISLDEGDDIKY